MRELLILGRVPGIGVKRLRALVNHLGDPLAVRRAGVLTLAAVPGIGRLGAEHLARFFRSSELAAAELEAGRQIASLRALDASMLHLWHADYPARLSAIYDAPPVLFVRGQVQALGGQCVAVVGTRRPTAYGLAVAEHFARELCGAGATVVSGLARGIDTKAHRAAIEAGGRTVAVIGTGPDRCYPPENRRLAEEIAVSGAVVSEFPPGTAPEPGNFPRRNRIISGLSLGTLVAESDTDGGAMITAYLALDQNREVFAVPGSIHSGRSRGCHSLIRDGKAALAGSIDDVLANLGPGFLPSASRSPAPGPAPVAIPDHARAIAEMIGAEPVHLDDLAGRTELPVPDLLVALLTLEMANVVRQLPGKYFIRRF